MTEENTSDLGALHWRVNQMEERLASLERPEKRSFFAVDDWKDGLKLLGLPLAFFLACYTFYDDVFLRFLNRDAATVEAVQSKIAELQSLNAEIYLLNVAGKTENVSAILEAKSGRRQRLINETYDYWASRPDYFTPSEKQMLANELLSQSRTDLAMDIADDYADEISTTIEKADLALFRGRILSHEGPIFDLDAAREQFRDSLRISETLPKTTQRNDMWAKTLSFWLYIESYYETGCAAGRGVVDPLRDLLFDPDAPADLGGLKAQTVMLIEKHDATCGG